MLNENYWNNRYLKDETGWDIGYASPPIIDYFKTIKDKSIKVLIPGSGNAYEAEILWEMGFTNLYVLDFAPVAIQNIKSRLPEIPEHHFLQQDFFTHQARYDIIVEQTFFCALTPNLRFQYADKMTKLLKRGGKLVGLLFNDELFSDHPPYGGSYSEYQDLFSIFFKIHQMHIAPNSIPARQGRELFIELTPKA